MARRLVNWKEVQMNREIKFRGICIEVKGWEYGGFVKGKSGRSYIFNGNDEGFLEGDINIVIPETVGQFTGLLDKNGEEIYEGDIVMYSDKSTPLVVGFENGSFVLKKDGKTYVYNINPKELEVIGNIHENKDLI